MAELHISITQLRGMIGQPVFLDQHYYQIIEVIEVSQELVLQHSSDHSDIQPDQYGDAHRRVPRITTIPIFTADQREFHPMFLALDLIN